MNKGTKHTPEAIEKIKARRKLQLEMEGGSWNKGKKVGPRTEESRRRQSVTVKANWADPQWRIDRGYIGPLTYQGMHSRLFYLKKELGSATCQADVIGMSECLGPADDWSIKHSIAEDLLIDEESGRPYSMNVDDYARLCRSCHSIYDGKGQPWIGGLIKGEKHSSAKIKDAEVPIIRQRRSDGETLRSIAESFGVSISQIGKIANNKSRKTQGEN